MEDPIRLIRDAGIAGLKIDFDGVNLTMTQVNQQPNTINLKLMYAWQVREWQARFEASREALIAAFRGEPRDSPAKEPVKVELAKQTPVEAQEVKTRCDALINPVTPLDGPYTPPPKITQRMTGHEVQDWLKSFLSGRPLKASEIAQAADQANIAPKALRTAKERLGIKPTRQGNCWMWSLPVLAPVEAE